MTEFIDYVWKHLDPAEEEGFRLADDVSLEKIYQRGFIDARRYSFPQWRNACQKFSKIKGQYRFKREDLDSLKAYFFPSLPKRPFDPKRLKDGTRPLDWTNELFQKVLRFESNLTLEAWKKIVQTQILPKCKKGDNLLYNEYLRQLLDAILKQHASPLRHLELWYHFERESEAGSPESKENTPEVGSKTPSSAPIRDAFVAKPDETLKRTAIDKLYFHHGEAPNKDGDRESLDFLDELANLTDPEDEEDKL